MAWGRNCGGIMPCRSGSGGSRRAAGYPPSSPRYPRKVQCMREAKPVRVPYVALTLRAKRVKEQHMTAIEKVIDHGIYILGPEVQDFEKRFASYCGTRFAVGVADGTSA